MPNTTPPLHHLLKINVEQESIFGIIGRMEVLLDYFEKNQSYHSLIPFLKTYLIVTRAVALKTVLPHPPFRTISTLQDLDIVFASLYFEPLRLYLEQRRATTPWQVYFQYCQKRDNSAFVQMLLGINAHINADLTACLVQLSYQDRYDFNKINAVLSAVIPSVMQFLTLHYKDTLALGALLLPQLTQTEFTHIIIQWRNQAWYNAQYIQKHSIKQYLSSLHEQTETLAEELIDIFTLSMNPLHQRKRLYQLKINVR